MTPKVYSSFEEIDQDLRILRLKRQIEREQVKLHIQESKTSLYPTQLLGGVKGIVQKLFLTFVVKKITDRLR